MIEKHFTLDRSLPGPDHKASLESGEFAALVAGVRQVEAALGTGLKLPSESELKNLPIVRRSLVARTTINPGDVFRDTNVCAKRPGTGLSPMMYWQLLGRRATRRYEMDDMIYDERGKED